MYPSQAIEYHMRSGNHASVLRGPDNLTIHPVKNLGWLLRHWRDVRSLHVEQSINGGAYLVADGKDFIYVTRFADRRVLLGWINRPVFKGLTIRICGQPYTVGKDAPTY